MKSLLTFSILIYCFIGFSNNALSQEQIDFQNLAQEAEKEASSLQNDLPTLNDTPPTLNIDREYRQWSLNHRKKVLTWNHYSSVIIFFFVMTIMSLGLYFSYMQFRDSVGSQTKSEIAPSTVKLGHGGIEISSSVIGLLVLMVSLAFFYLYLENVYPVRVITNAPAPSGSAKP